MMRRGGALAVRNMIGNPRETSVLNALPTLGVRWLLEAGALLLEACIKSALMGMHREGQSIEEIVAIAHKAIDQVLLEIKDERVKTASASDDQNDEVGKDGKDGRSMKPPQGEDYSQRPQEGPGQGQEGQPFYPGPFLLPKGPSKGRFAYATSPSKHQKKQRRE
ncbi:hypothetical protein CSOJ01_01649 [Colletotrichum sojae]|uniref:Uncharacterized protein n=1 Tax=Colletotrichum sojae TaxID=2175907 RepID=A0A8H6JTU2_9PEZI|nr:hypothetical protein CSOJ01_01649 [Colletotrichum sojae]